MHTPGPWTTFNGKFLVTANADGSVPLNARIVAEFAGSPSTYDAWLIIAAPDLLRACLELVDAVGPETLERAGKLARAAIAKAQP